MGKVLISSMTITLFLFLWMDHQFVKNVTLYLKSILGLQLLWVAINIMAFDELHDKINVK